MGSGEQTHRVRAGISLTGAEPEIAIRIASAYLPEPRISTPTSKESHAQVHQ
jgi:hypothetical protein